MIAALAFSTALAVAGAPETPADPFEFHRWGSFEAHIYSGRGNFQTEVVSVSQADYRHGRYLVARKRERLGNDPETTVWADGRTCSALAAMPTTMRLLSGYSLGQEAPGFRPSPTRPGYNELSVTADGPSYVIDAPGQYAWDLDLRVRFTAGGRTPVAEWVEATLKAPSSCWRPTPPEPTPKEGAFGR